MSSLNFPLGAHHGCKLRPGIRRRLAIVSTAFVTLAACNSSAKGPAHAVGAARSDPIGTINGAIATWERILRQQYPNPIDRRAEQAQIDSMLAEEARRHCASPCRPDQLQVAVASDKAVLAAYRRQPLSPYEPQMLRDYITLHTAWIDTTASELGIRVPQGLVAGAVPWACFNASTATRLKPPLVLVNTGFETLQGEYAKVAALALPIDENGNLPSRELSDDEIRQHLDQHPVLEQMLATLVVTNLVSGYTHADTTFSVGGQNLVIAASLLSSTARFVLAHEFAHAIRGDDAGLTAKLVGWSDVGDRKLTVDVLSADAAEEIAADSLGLALLMKNAVARSVGKQRHFSTDGAEFLFTTLATIDSAYVVVFGSPMTDKHHPSADIRRLALRRQLGRNGGLPPPAEDFAEAEHRAFMQLWARLRPRFVANRERIFAEVRNSACRPSAARGPT